MDLVDFASSWFDPPDDLQEIEAAQVTEGLLSGVFVYRHNGSTPGENPEGGVTDFVVNNFQAAGAGAGQGAKEECGEGAVPIFDGFVPCFLPGAVGEGNWTARWSLQDSLGILLRNLPIFGTVDVDSGAENGLTNKELHAVSKWSSRVDSNHHTSSYGTPV
jgi:hypothetical protein